MNLKNAFLKIPEILNKELSPEEAIKLTIDLFEQELSFDYVLVCYLNVEGIEVKGMSEPNNKVTFSDKNLSGNLFNSFIKQKQAILFNGKQNQAGLLDEIGINIKDNFSAAVLPLSIKKAIFGIIIGIKFGEKEIDENSFLISQGYAGALSYIIKDAELSNVFKLQLKILNDNVIEKTSSLNDIKEQNEKIKEAEKIKTDFLMNMSHALRTPLNAIISLSEALEMKIFGELNEKQTEYIVDIQNSGKEMLGLINDILDMSKIEAGAMKLIKRETDINLLVKESVNIINSLAKKKNIKVKIKIPKTPVIILADAQKINQILYNLLSNAVKFTRENGNIEASLKKLKNAVQICIKDDGIGINKKYHGKIFGKFEQIDSSYSGKYASTGLGLTITKELVDMHGGKIWLESVEGKGSSFIFELPIT